MTDGKKEYLQMLQEPICRMSTISAIFKGFAATIVAGISAISYSSTNVWVLALSFLPVLAFAILGYCQGLCAKLFAGSGGPEVSRQ